MLSLKLDSKLLFVARHGIAIRSLLLIVLTYKKEKTSLMWKTGQRHVFRPVSRVLERYDTFYEGKSGRRQKHATYIHWIRKTQWSISLLVQTWKTRRRTFSNTCNADQSWFVFSQQEWKCAFEAKIDEFYMPKQLVLCVQFWKTIYFSCWNFNNVEKVHQGILDFGWETKTFWRNQTWR